MREIFGIILIILIVIGAFKVIDYRSENCIGSVSYMTVKQLKNCLEKQ